MLTAHNRRGAQRGQACAGKARHHDEVTRLGHIATRGLGRRGGRSRRGGGSSTTLIPSLLSIGVGLSRASSAASEPEPWSDAPHQKKSHR